VKTIRPADPPKLEIKKDAKGMVTVVGSTIIPVSSAADLMHVVEEGLAKRHVSSTQMNRESSRSHLVISVLIEATNLQTQAVTRGKLSFVDLAGSERWVGGGGVCGREEEERGRAVLCLFAGRPSAWTGFALRVHRVWLPASYIHADECVKKCFCPPCLPFLDCL
jgi:hypothetical protein